MELDRPAALQYPSAHRIVTQDSSEVARGHAIEGVWPARLASLARKLPTARSKFTILACACHMIKFPKWGRDFERGARF